MLGSVCVRHLGNQDPLESRLSGSVGSQALGEFLGSRGRGRAK